jgi:hypothetical protein
VSRAATQASISRPRASILEHVQTRPSGSRSARPASSPRSPPDPAVTFSVLGDREVGGRSGTILEGESGANDPVGIALMVGMLEFARHQDASFAIVLREFSIDGIARA